MRLTSEQKAFRKQHLNASEFAAMLGVSPYKGDDRIALWCEKTGLVPREETDEDSDAFWFGHEQEPIVAKRFEQKSGKKLILGGSYEHPEHPWCACTVDRRILGERANAEIKIVGQHMVYDWKPSEEEGIPHYVMTQCQIQMACTKVPRTYVAALLGGTSLAVFCIEEQKDLQAHLLHEGNLFWEEVQSGKRPEVTGSESSKAMLQALYPKDTRPIMQATPEHLRIALARREADLSVSKYESIKDRATNMLLEACGEHAAIVHPDFRFSWMCDKNGKRRSLFKWKGEE